MQPKRHRILAMAPRGRDGLPLVVACWCAGGMGIFDGLRRGLSAATRELDRYAVGSYAVGCERIRSGARPLRALSRLPDLIICAAPWRGDVLVKACDDVHAAGGAVVCEVVSVEQADAALSAGADGLVAVGNEAGGWVGGDTTFVLLQAAAGPDGPPVWARGGIGPRTAAGCLAAGAAGVILDGAVLLARESDLPEEARRRLLGAGTAASRC